MPVDVVIPPRGRRRVRWRRFLLALGALFVAAQLVPVQRTNPPVVSDLVAPADVHALLKRACYDCHSNETRWPWYAYVAPSSWLVTSDVTKARKKLNFSEWGTYIADRQESKIREIGDEVRDGEMPLKIYRPLHPEAELAAADRALIQRWVSAGAGAEGGDRD